MAMKHHATFCNILEHPKPGGKWRKHSGQHRRQHLLASKSNSRCAKFTPSWRAMSSTPANGSGFEMDPCVNQSFWRWNWLIQYLSSFSSGRCAAICSTANLGIVGHRDHMRSHHAFEYRWITASKMKIREGSWRYTDWRSASPAPNWKCWQAADAPGPLPASATESHVAMPINTEPSYFTPDSCGAKLSFSCTSGGISQNKPGLAI